MKLKCHNCIQEDSWIFFILPTIQVSNLTSDESKYSIALMWLNFDIELKI